MRKIELNIKGMHCESCARLIEDALSEHKGIKEVTIDVKKNSGVISYDEKLTDEKQLMQIIKNEGYETSLKGK